MNRQALVAVLAFASLAMIPTAQAAQPLALLASSASEGVQLEWFDSGAADSYELHRTGEDGLVTTLVIDAAATSFFDSAEPGMYTYTLTAHRHSGEDTSNPAAALAWPSCLPGVALSPPGIIWPSYCYCPMPEGLDVLEDLICP